MSATVDKALQLWSLSDACYTLVAARENAVNGSIMSRAQVSSMGSGVASPVLLEHVC